MHGGEGDQGDQKFRVGRWDSGMGPPGLGVVGLAAAVLTLTAAFF